MSILLKIKGFLRWGFVILVVGLFGILTEWLMFHFGWITRNIPYLNKLFWPWMDYSRLVGEDYRVWLSNRGATKETWWLAYKWHLRNKVWNLNNLFKVPNPYENDWEVVEFVIDNLHKNNLEQTKVIQDGYWVASAGLKYIPQHEEDNIWQVNEGDVLSKVTSIIGTGYIWYKVGDWYSFRYSQCKIVNYGVWKGWRTLKMGTNHKRFSLTMKHQQIKPWK